MVRSPWRQDEILNTTLSVIGGGTVYTVSTITSSYVHIELVLQSQWWLCLLIICVPSFERNWFRDAFRQKPTLFFVQDCVKCSVISHVNYTCPQRFDDSKRASVIAQLKESYFCNICNVGWARFSSCIFFEKTRLVMRRPKEEDFRIDQVFTGAICCDTRATTQASVNAQNS